MIISVGTCPLKGKRGIMIIKTKENKKRKKEGEREREREREREHCPLAWSS